jgi:peptidoglycan/xylan/chitin deacetylase (PgdA/CDA1 family)
MRRVVDKVRGWGHGARQRWMRGPRILLYHRVIELDSDPQWLAVSPRNFEAHLSVLAKQADVMSLEEMHARHAAGELPPRAVALTFDDGYADNAVHAAPILKRAGMPATVFVSSLSVRQSSELYWDELDRLLLQGRSLPRGVAVEIGGTTHEFDLGGAVESPSRWNATLPARDSRQRTYLTLCGLLKPLEHSERERLLESLRAALGVEAGLRDTHRLMNHAQLRQLAAMLSTQSELRQREEIEAGKHELEREIGQPVNTFAYPYGGREDFDARSMAAARGAGYRLACANVPGVVDRKADSFALPRVLVRDWPEAVFQQQLSRWLDD